MYRPGHAAVNGNDRTDRLVEKNKHHKLLASRKNSSVEKLQTLPADTKPRTSHIDRLEERGVGRGSTRRSSLKRTRQDYRESDGRCKGNSGGTSAKRRGSAHMGF